MCLGVPGKVLKTYSDAVGTLMGAVSFGGITKEVCLAFLPEVQPGEHVIVHAGFAITQVDEQEAAETLRLLREVTEAGGSSTPDDDALR